MSYVDAIHLRYKDTIEVVERINGERVYQTYPAPYVFYYEHAAGSHTSIFGDACKKASFTDWKKFRKALAEHEGKRRIFESDVNPVFRCLHDRYTNVDAPTLNIGLFDIEVDFDPERGFAPVTDPFNKVTAISVHFSNTDQLVTLALRPPTIDLDEAIEIGNEFENTLIFDDEKELLDAFLTIIDDVDVLSGWNSEGFDIPYLVNRIARVLGKNALKRLCLWDQMPRERKYMKFKREHTTFDLVGRVHLDYLLLYQKHNTQQLHSYRLDYVGEIEVGENKTPYAGTLDDLYKKDFKKFIAYNRQDVALLVKIDRKRKYIELANQIAHANGVVLKTTTGSVALVEQAIINEMHGFGFVVPNRRRDAEDTVERVVGDDEDEDEGRTPVVGAYVAVPKFGLHDYVACVDINSLYPSTIRALNMSPETIVAQLRPDATMALVQQRIAEGTPRAEAWDGLFGTLEYECVMAQDTEHPITVDFEDGTNRVMTGAQLYAMIFGANSNLCISANGTIFKTDRDGMIPMLLAKWYSQRQEMQGKQKEFEKKAKAETDPEKKKEYEYWAGFWNQRQQARKILLNSLYGALLNEGLRFYDERLGQSVTLTGRSIVRHMNAKSNEVIAGPYDYRGEAIVYADTDSCYFSAVPILRRDPAYKEFDWTRESFIELYDGIADVVNESFPEFMATGFHTTLERGAIIKAGRELVASKALFIVKKKYACLMYDKEGDRLDTGNKPGKLKAMGLDLKRADTPKYMQRFLETVLMDLLTGSTKDEIFGKVKVFRRDFTDRPAWEMGSPKAVKALSDYADKVKKAVGGKITEKGGGKVNMPGHVRAALNWNRLCDVNSDKYSMRITDGSKIIVCKLRPNNLYRMDSVAFPIDEPHLPDWFKALPFDKEAMEQSIIDKKLDNLLGVLNWDLSETVELSSDQFFKFG